MSRLNERLRGDIDDFRYRVSTDPTGVLDPEGVVHHEFVSGNHGRKLDFDKIRTDSDFYIEWVSVYARAVRSMYSDRLPDALVGIANGANRLSESVAHLLGGKVMGLTTEKVDAKTVRLDDQAREVVRSGDVQFALTIEDVGTTGGTTSTAVEDLRGEGVRRIESVNFWQRNSTLPRLDVLRIPYGAVILDPLPMFSPEDCPTVDGGYCKEGVELIPHSS